MDKPKAVYTGRKDAKGRMIFRGPRGGLFCRGPNGKKVSPVTRARSPMRRR